MSIVVLKFGGSVLQDETSLRKAVHEIYRWRREGHRVLAVVSALAGRTRQLLEHADRLDGAPGSRARAALVTLGEQESAALLGLQLERAGLKAAVLSPASVAFLAAGNPLEAEPRSINTDAVHNALERSGVVVFPGFTGLSPAGEAVALGRGGSDLTAVFLANALNAQICRLIKDVDGLYESDPAAPGPPPRRFRSASYDDALQTDGTIIQHRAVHFAREHDLKLELGSLNSNSPTRISPGDSALEQSVPDPRPLRVGLLGFGTVGCGVATLLADHPEWFVLVGTLVRRPRPSREFCQGLPSLLERQPDVLIEVTGDDVLTEAAFTESRIGGLEFVTANKAWLARRPDATGVLASGSAGGSVPVLEALSRGPVACVEGILCGTANFVLERMDQGDGFEEAVREAQRLGLAESDSSRDLDGRDAADKLAVIAQRVGVRLDPTQIPRDTIHPSTQGGRRQVASLRSVNGHWSAEVRVQALPADSRLHEVRAEENGVLLRTGEGDAEFLHGKGAGRWPTAEAVLADLLELARRSREASHVG